MTKLFKKAQKPYRTVEVGGYIIDIYYNEGVLTDSYLTITTVDKTMKIKIGGNTHAYGYLFAAAEQGMTEQLHGYAAAMLITGVLLTQDQKFTNDIVKSINAWQKRTNAEAAKKAKAVTPEQETANEALMRDVVRYSEATPKERKKMRRESKKNMQEAMQEVKNNVRK